MNGKQAKRLRRVARALAQDGVWRAYYLDQQWKGRREKSAPVGVTYAQVPGTGKVYTVIVREEYKDDRDRVVRERTITDLPIALTVGRELRLQPGTGRAWLKAFKRNFRRLARKEGAALQLVQKLRRAHG